MFTEVTVNVPPRDMPLGPAALDDGDEDDGELDDGELDEGDVADDALPPENRPMTVT
jgi:hypothetical protein